MKHIYLLILLFSSILCFGQEWKSIASLPDNFNTDHSFAFAIDGTGYIVAGTNASGASASFYSYDPDADEWTKKEDFPGTARGFAIGEVWNGKAYFGFGLGGGVRQDDLWEYDPVTDAWTQLASCDCEPRIHPAMVALNGEIYVGLGGTPNGNSNDWWVYNIDDNEWEERERFPAAPRHHPFQFTDGEYVYVGFGHGDDFISNQWYRYNTLDDTWIEVQTLPSEGRVAGTQMSYNGLGLILSGDGDNHSNMETGEFWLYEPIPDEWTALPPHPGESRWAPASFILNDEMYLLNGERNGFYYTDNYKFDLSALNKPILSLSSIDTALDFGFSDDQCNASQSRKLMVGTMILFEEDVNMSLVIDQSSTAVEGDDFILEIKEATLLAGDNMVEFDLIILDDAVVNGDKTLQLNLVTEAKTGVDTLVINIVDNDIEFGTESTIRAINVGEGNKQSIAPFARFYENARSQMLYRADMLKNAGVGSGLIEKIAYDVVNTGGQNYVDFTMSIAHTTISQFNGNSAGGLAFEEVYSGTYTSVNGINDIVFDTPFDYDGESNLIIQTCFDNNDYTYDDITVSSEVGYNSTIVVRADNVNGCPNFGDVVSTSELPNLIIYKDGFFPLYVDVNNKFQSEINENESIYFATNDSVYAIIENINGFDPSCFTSELSSNTNMINISDDIEWIDRVYWIENEGGSPNDYEVTILMPNIEEVDFYSENFVGLYTSNEILVGEEPQWVNLDVISSVANEEFVTIKFRFQGNGYYTVGGVGVSTNTVEQDIDIAYDRVTIYDSMGRVVATNSTEINSTGLPVGVYFKTYTNNGQIVKSVKVMPK
ncbi:MAG: N-acetylneuraminic acid mutarotase [Saprospiraceae bacterium]|jgi:N-acetylneuraminic acid mutarotase